MKMINLDIYLKKKMIKDDFSNKITENNEELFEKKYFSFGKNDKYQLELGNNLIIKNITKTIIFNNLDISKFECGDNHTICFSKSKN